MLDIIMNILNTIIAIGDFLWGMPMVISLCGVAILYTVGTRGFQFTHLGHAIKNTIGKQFQPKTTTKKGVSSFKATCMALCNTLGVGNIAGVSLAIALGGPGAVFWIWVAALLALIIKYGEILLGVKFREIDPVTGMYRGGIMWYIKKGLHKRWHWIATVYAAFYVLININAPATQVNTIASSVTNYFQNIPSIAIGIVCALLMALILIGGLRRISEFAGMVIPFMTILYFIVALIILIMNITALPEIIGLIFKSAVTDVSAIAGGFGGASVAMAARYGLARGFYSNGAGMGDAPFAHSSADVDNPCKQGLWGITEVVVDVTVCTFTALTVLVTGAWETGKLGAPLTATAIGMNFNSDAFGNILVMIIMAFFGFTTAVMCAYYGEICLRYFTTNKVITTIYRCILCIFAALATSPIFVERVDILWRVGDFNIAGSTLLSLLVLVLIRKEVFTSTKEYKESLKIKTSSNSKEVP